MWKACFGIVVFLALATCAPRKRPSPEHGNHDARSAAEVEPARPPTLGRRCGYVDESGALVIARRFDEAHNFAAGVAVVREDGKYGFIDAKGGYVIAPSFNGARSFREGLAVVCVDGKGCGFIRPSGVWAIPPTFATADSFSDGLAVVKDDPDEAQQAGPFDGREVVQAPAGSVCESGDDGGDGPGRYFLIDQTGKRMSGKGYPCITRMSGGLAAVLWNGKWGYVDRNGKEIIPPRFERAGPFGDGLAAVLVARRSRASYKVEDDDDGGEGIGHGTWGFIDRKGTFVVRPKIRATELGVLSEGLISVEGLWKKDLMASAVGRNALARRAKEQGTTLRALVEGLEQSNEWAGYLDRKGKLRLAVPYCGFDDPSAGWRSFREMSGGTAAVFMQRPSSVVPFACADALEDDVLMFIDRRGEYLEAPLAYLARRSPERLVPQCRDNDEPRAGADRFIWQ
jgi:hypothetical protein